MQERVMQASDLFLVVVDRSNGKAVGKVVMILSIGVLFFFLYNWNKVAHLYVVGQYNKITL